MPCEAPGCWTRAGIFTGARDRSEASAPREGPEGLKNRASGSLFHGDLQAEAQNVRGLLLPRAVASMVPTVVFLSCRAQCRHEGRGCRKPVNIRKLSVGVFHKMLAGLAAGRPSQRETDPEASARAGDRKDRSRGSATILFCPTTIVPTQGSK